MIDENWKKVPLRIRVVENICAVSTVATMLAGIFDSRFLLIGVPLMIRGLYLESRNNGYAVDLSKYK